MRCADGRIPELFDLFHLFFFPQAEEQVDTPLGYCYYPRLYDLPSIWSLLPNETDLFRPKELVDTSAALFAIGIPVTLCIILARYGWDYVDPSFNSINPSHKKWYVVANLSKAFFLGIMALNTKFLRELLKMFSDDFGGILTKRSIVMYVVTDVVALALVPKLPRSTIIHHVLTFMLGTVTWSCNLTIKGYKGILSIAKMPLVYGTICCISFMVNAYLALRVVYPKSKAVKVLCYLSLVSYLICCGVNWTYQLYWLVTIISAGEFSLYAAIYIFLMAFIVNDDIVLIKWLLKQSSPMASNNKDD